MRTDQKPMVVAVRLNLPSPPVVTATTSIEVEPPELCQSETLAPATGVPVSKSSTRPQIVRSTDGNPPPGGISTTGGGVSTTGGGGLGTASAGATAVDGLVMVAGPPWQPWADDTTRIRPTPRAASITMRYKIESLRQDPPMTSETLASAGSDAPTALR